MPRHLEGSDRFTSSQRIQDINALQTSQNLEAMMGETSHGRDSIRFNGPLVFGFNSQTEDGTQSEDYRLFIDKKKPQKKLLSSQKV